MKNFESLVKDIKNKNFLPIYFLEGEEPYYIDKISELLEKEVLSEEERGFNQTVVYGMETNLDDLIGLAKQFPMGAERQVVVVKEAGNLSFEGKAGNKSAFESYVENPQLSTVLVVNYKYKSLDKRKSLSKLLAKNNFLHTSVKMYDNQIPAWIGDLCKNKGLAIDEKSKAMLTEYLGNDLLRIENEIEKLRLILGDKKAITPELIEKNIGISKEYNNFELRKAVVERNLTMAYKIVDYFGKNQKNNPIVVTLSALNSLFTNIIIAHTTADKSQKNLAAELKVSPYFVGEYFTAMKNFPLKKATGVIAILRETDMKSKGLGVSSQADMRDILMEMMYKIFH